MALSAVLLAVLISRIRIADLGDILSKLYLPALLAYAAISLASTGLRALRYKWLLEPRRIGWGPMLLVTLARNAFDDLLPARVGALSYIYFMNRNLGFSFESAASSFIVAFILDFLTLGPFVVLAALSIGFGSAGVPTLLLFIAGAAFLLAMLIIVWKLEPLLGILVGIFGRIIDRFGWGKKKFASISRVKLAATLDELREVRKRGVYGRVLVLSVLIRIAKYAALYVLLFALLRSRGIGWAELSVGKIVLVITGAEMTSALPIKGLADFGTWESAWALAFRLMGFDASLAVLSGLGLHLITNLFEYSLGLAALLALTVVSRKRR